MSNLTFDSIVGEIAEDVVGGKFGEFGSDVTLESLGTPGSAQYNEVSKAIFEQIQDSPELMKHWDTDQPGSDFMNAIVDSAKLLATSDVNDLTAGDAEVLAEEARTDAIPQLTEADAFLNSVRENPESANYVSSQIAFLSQHGTRIDGLTPEKAKELEEKGVDGDVLASALGPSEEYGINVSWKEYFETKELTNDTAGSEATMTIRDADSQVSHSASHSLYSHSKESLPPVESNHKPASDSVEPTSYSIKAVVKVVNGGDPGILKAMTLAATDKNFNAAIDKIVDKVWARLDRDSIGTGASLQLDYQCKTDNVSSVANLGLTEWGKIDIRAYTDDAFDSFGQKGQDFVSVRPTFLVSPFGTILYDFDKRAEGMKSPTTHTIESDTAMKARFDAYVERADITPAQAQNHIEKLAKSYFADHVCNVLNSNVARAEAGVLPCVSRVCDNVQGQSDRLDRLILSTRGDKIADKLIAARDDLQPIVRGQREQYREMRDVTNSVRVKADGIRNATTIETRFAKASACLDEARSLAYSIPFIQTANEKLEKVSELVFEASEVITKRMETKDISNEQPPKDMAANDTQKVVRHGSPGTTVSDSSSSDVSKQVSLNAERPPKDSATNDTPKVTKQASDNATIPAPSLNDVAKRPDSNPEITKPISPPQNSGEVVVVEEYKAGRLVDVIIKDTDTKTETRASDIAGTIKDDPAAQRVLQEIGTDAKPKETLDAIIKALDASPKDSQGVTVEQTDSVDNRLTVPSTPDVVTSPKDTAAGEDRDEKFAKHNEAYTGLMEKRFHSKTNMSVCYHDFLRTYNAYKGGIEIDGKVPDIGNVLVSFRNFLDSDPVEALLDAIWNKVYEYLVEKEKPNDVTNDTNRPVELAAPTDKLGVADNGNVDIKNIDVERAKGIELARDNVSPFVGTRFGADMGKVDKGSDNELTVRTTNPNPDKTDKTMQVRLNDTSRFTFPDVRLVEFRGTQALIDPFGRVMFSSDSKFTVGETRLQDLDVTKTDKGKEALACYAENRGLSVEQARDEISQKAEARFCDRVEANYKVEAAGMDRTDKDGNRVGVIPAAQEKLTALRGQDTLLGRIEALLGKDNKLSADIQDARTKLQGAIETQEARVDSLYERKSDLETLAGKVEDKSLGSLDDRFRVACDSEMRAIGRSALDPSPMSSDDKTAIDKTITSGNAEIAARVERFNESKPELDKISYDPKTGDFVDRFGFNQKGDYVGNQNGPFMAEGVTGPDSMNKDDIDKYKAEHFDESRFPDTASEDWEKDRVDVNAETVEVHAQGSSDSSPLASVTTSDDTGADVAIGDDAAEPDADGATTDPVDPTEPPKTAASLDGKPDVQDGEIKAVDASVAATGISHNNDEEKPKENDTDSDTQNKKEDVDVDFPSEFTDALQGLKDLLEENLSPDELAAKAESLADKVVTGLETIVDPTTGETNNVVLEQFADEFVGIIAKVDVDAPEPVGVVVEALGRAVGDGPIGGELMDAISAAGEKAEVPDVINQLLKDSVDTGSAIAGTDIPASPAPVVRNEDEQPGDLSSAVDMGDTIDEILTEKPYEFVIEEVPDVIDGSSTDKAAIDASVESFQTLELGTGVPDIPTAEDVDMPAETPDIPTVDSGLENNFEGGDDSDDEVSWGE